MNPELSIQGEGKAIPTRAPDLLAQIEFLPTSLGGRETPANSSYRPNHDFGLSSFVCATHEYIGQKAAHPAETVIARLWLAMPELLYKQLYPGFTFAVHEGSRKVANATVIEVLNDSLLKNSAA